jgi:hypothetical protein
LFELSWLWQDGFIEIVTKEWKPMLHGDNTVHGGLAKYEFTYYELSQRLGENLSSVYKK